MSESIRLDRTRYAALYGPTTGDRIRLADTDLLIEIEQDLCGGPGLAGDEAVEAVGGAPDPPVGSELVDLVTLVGFRSM